MIYPPDGATSTQPIRQVATFDRRNSSGGIPPRRGNRATITTYYTTNDIHEQIQSAYRSNHSTEIALLIVCTTLLYILDERKVVKVVLLNMVDHAIILWNNCNLSCPV